MEIAAPQAIVVCRAGARCVIFVSPPWFFYEAMILGVGATPIKTRLSPPASDLDLDAIAAAITPRTRMLLLNLPTTRPVASSPPSH
jgi:aspartate aminotransferase